ncbi:hypothetical protein FI667_g6135, partial [Globisporangium splendens]
MHHDTATGSTKNGEQVQPHVQECLDVSQEKQGKRTCRGLRAGGSLAEVLRHSLRWRVGSVTDEKDDIPPKKGGAELEPNMTWTVETLATVDVIFVLVRPIKVSHAMGKSKN